MRLYCRTPASKSHHIPPTTGDECELHYDHSIIFVSLLFSISRLYHDSRWHLTGFMTADIAEPSCVLSSCGYCIGHLHALNHESHAVTPFVDRLWIIMAFSCLSHSIRDSPIFRQVHTYADDGSCHHGPYQPQCVWQKEFSTAYVTRCSASCSTLYVLDRLLRGGISKELSSTSLITV